MTRALLALLLVAACNRVDDVANASPPLAPVVAVPRTPSAEAGTLLAKLECNRCHEVPGVAPPPRDKQCFGCHQQIHAGTFPASSPALSRWRARITSFRDAPSLIHADRLRRHWVESYLLRPHDVRPGSIAQMPRLAISQHEATVLARFLVPEDGDARPRQPRDYPFPFPGARALEVHPDEVARGEELFRTLACARCHRFAGANVDDEVAHAAGARQAAPLDAAWRLAPDLRHARDRVQPAKLAEWIARPRGAMPNLGVTDTDARALAAYIATATLRRVSSPVVFLPRFPSDFDIAARRLVPVLDREVTWAEVEREVFRDTCWHCHAVPDFARGDGGPGNSGGFGFQPRGLDLSSYAGISMGSFDDLGERRSVFARFSEQVATPRLIVQLLARHVEEGGLTPGVDLPNIIGMPLGLPALPLDKIRLVATWIAQGRPN